MRIFNTATRQKEELTPLHEGVFNIYVCGPTVYNLFHLGNARPFITYDTLRRYLLHKGYKVNYVQNFTDIDDKMIARANQEGTTLKELADRMITEYYKDADSLNIMRATVHPRATEYIPEIIDLIQRLYDKGYAYTGADGVYFDIEKYTAYGKLSGHNLEDLEAGKSERIAGTDNKKNPFDFNLWKFKKEGEPAWQSPWGDGRPGWHIECSAMSMKELGETIDIHCGGVDLVFPHHENEIAQSEAATGQTFVRYWMHNGFININNIKMSKSEGHFFLVRDLSKLYPYQVIRYFMLQAHYRMPLNFSLSEDGDEPNSMEAATTSFRRIQNSVENLTFISESAPVEAIDTTADQSLQEAILKADQDWHEAMDDDLNTADAIAAIFELVRAANSAAALRKISRPTILQARDKILLLCDVLGLDPCSADNCIPAEVLALVEQRAAAKKARDFTLADSLRDQITQLGFKVEDTPEGTHVGKL